MTKKRYFFLVILLGALTTIAPFSIDMYLPGFTAIAKVLNSNVAEVAVGFIQAIGACAARVAANAMVRDLLPVEENTKVFSMLMLILGVLPIIAPTAGSYITDFLGWQAVFIILAVITTLIFIAFILDCPRAVNPIPIIL